MSDLLELLRAWRWSPQGGRAGTETCRKSLPPQHCCTCSTPAWADLTAGACSCTKAAKNRTVINKHPPVKVPPHGPATLKSPLWAVRPRQKGRFDRAEHFTQLHLLLLCHAKEDLRGSLCSHKSQQHSPSLCSLAQPPWCCLQGTDWQGHELEHGKSDIHAQIDLCQYQ